MHLGFLKAQDRFGVALALLWVNHLRRDCERSEGLTFVEQEQFAPFCEHFKELVLKWTFSEVTMVTLREERGAASIFRI